MGGGEQFGPLLYTLELVWVHDHILFGFILDPYNL